MAQKTFDLFCKHIALGYDIVPPGNKLVPKP